MDWAEQEEQKELAALEAAKTSAEAQLNKPVVDPLKDPENIKWMKEQMTAAQKIYGETFGEDIDETFDGT